MDPFNAVSRIWQPVYFLANAGLFATRFTNWFFTTFYCIPVQRKGDKKGKFVDNRSSFEKCDQFLSNKGILYIAPEGGSYEGRQLERIKTGTARIALSAEARNNFNLGLKIIPIGLVYEDPTRFRSRLMINVGAPITITEYREAYQQETFEAAKQLTKVIETALSNLIINPFDKEEDQLLGKAEILYRSHDSKFNIQKLNWTQKLAEGFRNMGSPPQRDLLHHLNTYFEQLKKIQTNDAAVAKGRKNHILRWFDLTLYLLGFPLFCYGLLNHFVLLLAMHGIWNKLNLYPTYESTVKFVVILIFLPLSYYVQSEVIAAIFGVSFSWWYLLTLIPSGVFASYYWKKINQKYKDWKWFFWSKKNKDGAVKLEHKRAAVWKELNRLVKSNTQVTLGKDK